VSLNGAPAGVAAPALRPSAMCHAASVALQRASSADRDRAETTPRDRSVRAHAGIGKMIGGMSDCRDPVVGELDIPYCRRAVATGSTGPVIGETKYP
jgi:hypothetical protein